MTALLLLTLTGCAPQDANVSGDWFVWLSANSSATISEGKLNLDGATVFECRRGWEPETCGFEEGYIGPRNGYSGTDNFIGGACRREEGNTAGVCDGAFINNCGAEALGDLDEDGFDDGDVNKDGTIDGYDGIQGFADECEDIENAEFQTWLRDDGYYGMTGKIDAWRSEAIINSEGDLQLTVHTDLGKGQDFRYHFSIDPDFHPVECVTGEDGKPEIAEDDGSDWVDEWSEDEDGYRIFYLNAGAYQVNPNDSETWWYLNTERLSGWGFAKYAAEEFYSHAARYGNYDEDGNGQGFLGITNHETPDILDYHRNIQSLCEQVFGWECIYLQTDDDGDGESEADGDCDDEDDTVTSADCPPRNSEEEPLSWQDEMIVMAGAATNKGVARFQHKLEDNTWRPIDETITGLDGWMEVHSSWVRLKNGSKVKEGGKVEGDFQIVYDGAESGSRLLVTGEFKVDDLREDQWGYEILEDAKREENDQLFCTEDD